MTPDEEFYIKSLQEQVKFLQDIIEEKDKQIKMYDDFLIKINEALFSQNWVEVQRLLQIASTYVYSLTGPSSDYKTLDA